MEYSTLDHVIRLFGDNYPAFTVGGLRHQVFYEDSNGLKAAGAIVRNGRRVLINVPKYFQWLESQSNVRKK